MAAVRARPRPVSKATVRLPVTAKVSSTPAPALPPISFLANVTGLIVLASVRILALTAATVFLSDCRPVVSRIGAIPLRMVMTGFRVRAKTKVIPTMVKPVEAAGLIVNGLSDLKPTSERTVLLKSSSCNS